MSKSRTSGIIIEPVKLNAKYSELGKTNGDDSSRNEHDFTFTGKRTYSPSMGEAISVDGKGRFLLTDCVNNLKSNTLFLESPRENNSKDSPASQADSGVFSIASSASPSKLDGGLNSDVRSPDSPSRSVPCLDPAGASQCE